MGTFSSKALQAFRSTLLLVVWGEDVHPLAVNREPSTEFNPFLQKNTVYIYIYTLYILLRDFFPCSSHSKTSLLAAKNISIGFPWPLGSLRHAAEGMELKKPIGAICPLDGLLDWGTNSTRMTFQSNSPARNKDRYTVYIGNIPRKTNEGNKNK